MTRAVKHTSVRDIMSDALVTTDAISEVGVAADIMIQNQVRYLLVVKDDDHKQTIKHNYT